MKLHQTRKAAGLLLQASVVLLFSGPTLLADEPVSAVGTATEPAGPEGEEKRTERRIEVRVESRSESKTADGPAKIQGRVTVIGPDGVKTEYDLSNPEGRALILQMEGGAEALKISGETGSGRPAIPGSDDGNGFSTPEVLERVMIGVACDAAPELLRKHLKLDDAGLVVYSVSEKSPAAEAGLEVHDVLLSINEVRLQTREQFVQAVKELENQSVKLQIIRSGEPRELTITPRKMLVHEAVAGSVESGNVVRGFAIGDRQPGFPDVFPGVIIDEQFPDSPQAMQRLLKKFGSQAQQQSRRAAAAAAGAAAGAAADAGAGAATESSGNEELRRQIEELRGEMRAMLQELRAEKKQQGQ